MPVDKVKAVTGKKVVNKKEVKVCGECDKSPCKCCDVCKLEDCVCKKAVQIHKPEPELKELFVKLGKHTEAMEILGVGCLVRSKGELCFVPGIKLLCVGKDCHILTKS